MSVENHWWRNNVEGCLCISREYRLDPLRREKDSRLETWKDAQQYLSLWASWGGYPGEEQVRDQVGDWWVILVRVVWAWAGVGAAGPGGRVREGLKRALTLLKLVLSLSFYSQISAASKSVSRRIGVSMHIKRWSKCPLKKGQKYLLRSSIKFECKLILTAQW